MANEKEKRVKYIRLLEKFAKSAIAALKKENFDQELFDKLIEKNKKLIENAEPVYLDNAYTKGLENFANGAIFGTSKEDLLRQANALEKLKNAKFKKEKHKNKKFDEY